MKVRRLWPGGSSCALLPHTDKRSLAAWLEREPVRPDPLSGWALTRSYYKGEKVTNEYEGMSDMAAIRHFFFKEIKVAEFSAEFKALDDKAKTQLGEGIRNGSLTY